jgi:hypothetical protein
VCVCVQIYVYLWDMGPYIGPSMGPIWAHIWAHDGANVGPNMGPSWAQLYPNVDHFSLPNVDTISK